ncbi:TNF receptor-associated factor 3-like isoform X2 [Hydra vulgaris]|uniref:TNF receptor-associated factor 3-like isoform X2 n=1 Tax=Hydra vulgaris TaxID=6087 RepID=A0ABM4CC99_HYDVU
MGSLDPEKCGGYDAHFLDELSDEYECPVCLMALREPVLTLCGHRLCFSCSEEIIKRNNGAFICPLDKTILNSEKIFPDKFTERAILQLKVKCGNFLKSCPWTGELNTVNIHEEKCERLPLCCVNQCGMKILRKEMSSHITESCDNTIIPCQYLNIGCKFKGMRKEHETHANSSMQTHLSLAISKLDALENKITLTVDTLENKIASKVNALENKIMLTVNALENKIISKVESLETKIASKLENKITSTVEPFKNKNATEVVALENKIMLTVNALENKILSKVESLETKIASKLENKITSTVESFKNKNATEVVALEKKIMSKVESLETKIASKLENKITSKVESFENKNASEVVALKMKITSTVDALKNELILKVDAQQDKFMLHEKNLEVIKAFLAAETKENFGAFLTEFANTRHIFPPSPFFLRLQQNQISIYQETLKSYKNLQPAAKESLVTQEFKAFLTNKLEGPNDEPKVVKNYIIYYVTDYDEFYDKVCYQLCRLYRDQFTTFIKQLCALYRTQKNINK